MAAELSSNEQSRSTEPSIMRSIIAVIMIATGVVFMLSHYNIVDLSGSWWVIYTAIPGLMMISGAITALLREKKLTPGIALLAFFGLAALAASAIMVVDPTWSFIQTWHIDRIFRFFDRIHWGSLWQWVLIAIGVLAVVFGAAQRSNNQMVFGAIVILIGATFLFNVSWNIIWPLIIIAIGGSMVLKNRHTEA